MAESEKETQAAENWRRMYRDLYCAVWFATEEEFDETAVTDGINHAETVAEAHRDWQQRDYKAADIIASLTARLSAAERKAVDGWIRTSEKLPKDAGINDGDYILFWSAGYASPGRDKAYKAYLFDYWMPLPTPPADPGATDG
jgi:hypothetical protein